MLNAKNHEREAKIIEDAGQLGAVTIATNMAGRGVDIKLGDGVLDSGGLYVLGTERHESPPHRQPAARPLRPPGGSGRDALLPVGPGRGRCACLPATACTRSWTSSGPADGEPIEAKMLTNQIERAQKKVEEFHFVIRKNVVKYDDVLNDQRSQVYARRRQILEGEDLRESVRRAGSRM